MRTTFRLDDHLLREAKRVAAESSRTLTAVVGRLRNHPHCVIVHPGQRHWGIFVDLCKQVKARRTAKSINQLIKDFATESTENSEC